MARIKTHNAVRGLLAQAAGPTVKSVDIEEIRSGANGILELVLTSSHGAKKRYGPKFNNDKAGWAMAAKTSERLTGMVWG
jgi:hypothetical protein